MNKAIEFQPHKCHHRLFKRDPAAYFGIWIVLVLSISSVATGIARRDWNTVVLSLALTVMDLFAAFLELNVTVLACQHAYLYEELRSEKSRRMLRTDLWGPRGGH